MSPSVYWLRVYTGVWLGIAEELRKLRSQMATVGLSVEHLDRALAAMGAALDCAAALDAAALDLEGRAPSNDNGDA